MDETLRTRKRQHLEICLDRGSGVESGTTRFEDLSLYHRSLPETDPGSIDLATEFLGYKLSQPIMISCMTGGSEEGLRLNRLLAASAAEHGIAVGTGSIRVMLRHPETQSHFEMKSLAPDVPVLANIGAAQLAEFGAERIIEAVEVIDADGLYVHLNAAQEFFQIGGDKDFRGWRDQIEQLISKSPFPVLIKETGAGIPPVEGLPLLRSGAAYIDTSGVGGTDWVAVETAENDDAAGLSFRTWGYPSAALVLAYRQIIRAGGESGKLTEDRIIASGGLRTPKDYALALAGGAYLAASALPFIRIAAESGPEGISEYVGSIENGLRAAMSLSGCSTLEAFRKSRLNVAQDLADFAESLAEEALAETEGNAP